MKASLRGGAQNVLIFWPILSLAVLIALVLIKKKSVYTEDENEDIRRRYMLCHVCYLKVYMWLWARPLEIQKYFVPSPYDV